MENLLNGYKTITQIEKDLVNRKEEFWIKRGEEMALRLFKEAAVRVPAYKNFLQENKINPSNITTIKDFKKVPSIDKDNYLRKYPLPLLCWDGEFNSKSWIISTTSGSTGEPFYFPRQDDQDNKYSLLAELYLRNNFQIQNKSTLYINGFAMGAWIGGVFTYEAVRRVAKRGNYKLSIITPGIFKHEIIKAIKNLGGMFDQVIIGGYPPMIKDTIDDGIDMGINWHKYNIGFIFSAEGFNEHFRNYIVSKTGLKNYYVDTLNHYGAVDLGTMAHETPISIFIRKQALQSEAAYKDIFDSVSMIPTFAQYIPELFYFEEDNKHLYCSSYSGIPLVRYDLKDNGGIYTFKSISRILNKHNININLLLDSNNLGQSVWNLPFVYVFERSDFVVKLYGANIYPQTIRLALQSSLVSSNVTGKFTMAIELDKDQNQYLALNIELKRGKSISPELEKKIQDVVVQQLLKDNSEYRSNYKEAPLRQIPKVTLWNYEDENYFTPGIKQKWIKK